MVSEGGHNIPEETIRRIYYRGKYNFTNKFLHLSDYWILIDNSRKPFTFIAQGKRESDLMIFNDFIWQKIKNYANEQRRY